MNELNICPLCKSSKISKNLQTNTFEIYVCYRCKIAFTNPEPTIPAYEEMDFHSKNDPENYDKITTKKDLAFDWGKLIDMQTNMISTNFNKESAILEIGCGEGILLAELKENFFKNLKGYEPSRTAAVRAQKRNIEVVNDYFSTKLEHQKYDLVMMSHVFEHIKNIGDFLQQITNVLKENGSLMLTQTNYKGLIPRLQKEDWYAWVPDQHFWHFTPQSLKNILKENNFKVTQLNFCSLVHPHNLLYKIAKKIPSIQDQFILLATKN